MSKRAKRRATPGRETRPTGHEGRVPPRGAGQPAPGIDAGLELALRHARRGVPMSRAELAAYCQCSPQALWLIEKRALKKLRIRAAALNNEPQ